MAPRPDTSADRRPLPNDPEYEKDFTKAYSKLVEKIYSEQGSNILISPDEVH